MKKILAAIILALLPSVASAASYYFSDCGCDPTGTAHQQDACKRRSLADAYCAGDLSDAGAFSCGKSCYGYPPVCLDVCANAAIVNAFNCSGAIPSPGQVANPWCLAPEGTGTGSPLRNSFAAMSDGGAGSNLTTEVAHDDIIYLCSGYCDGAGSSTWYLQPTLTYAQASGTCNDSHAPVFLSPRVSGTSGHPITIEPYCVGTACEDITLSPDANHNGQWDAGEATTFMANGKDGTSTLLNMGYWTVEGDPASVGHPFLHFEGWGNNINQPAVVMLDCTDNSNDSAQNDGPTNVLFDGVSFNHTGETAWTSDDLGMTCFIADAYGNTKGGYIFKVNQAGGLFKVTNSTFTNTCGTINRWNNDNSTNATLTFDHNTVVNCGSVSDPNGFTGTLPYLSHFNFTNNNITDCIGAIASGNNLVHVAITDNTITVTGQRNLKYAPGAPNGNSATSRAEFAITADDGDTPPCTPNCQGDDITISRNKIYYLAQGATKMNTGIIFNVHNVGGAFPNGSLIENNIVSNIQSVYNSNPFDGAGIYVLTNTTGLTVRNNTVIGATSGNSRTVYIDGGTQTFTNNICSGGTLSPYATFTTAAAGSTINYNNFYAASGTPVFVDATPYSCASLNAAGLGTGNFCSAPAFAAPASFDYHLSGAQASIAAGASCTALDIDTQPRPSACDLGADQVFPTTIKGPIYLPYPPPPPVSVAK